ncbi:DMT family transporter [Fulvimarina sp. 2208YS6-2-32]|uniref:DMT family transporter n=1 Tax=Fulvimarina uroteuthidis TaxID=3098149 RepID=A0ABU5HZF5_9HYPH|nr:DMT family transporter [Fulvimarina sp. 2208YS6-2-32]MDY8108509.1 DMT family transporter [Fulvimarina sp. 2208YS6-2-32]
MSPASPSDLSARSLRGIAILLMAGAIFPVLDAGGKVLITNHGMSGAEVALVRLVQQALWMVPFLLWRRGVGGFRTPQLGLNLLRGALLGVGGILFFAALGFMPLADAVAIFMIAPMLQVLLAVPILKEPIGWKRILAILIGLVGALVIVRPSYAIFGLASLLPLATAFLVSLYIILSRFASRGTDPLAMMFHAGTGGAVTVAVIMVLAMPFDIGILAFSWPSEGRAFWLVLGVGVVGTLAHLLTLEAYARAPAAVLAPFNYAELIFAIIAGYLFFGDLPDRIRWIGMVIVIVSGLVLYWLERRSHRRRQVPAPVPNAL